MKETKLLGSLMPSHPDAKPIIHKLREKYNLPEISPDDNPPQDMEYALIRVMVTLIKGTLVMNEANI